MKKLLLLCLLFLSVQAESNTQVANCYNSLSTEISRHRAAILCQGTTTSLEVESVKDCYKNATDQRIEKTRAALLCNRSFSITSQKARISCYQNKNGDISYQRSAILCAGIKDSTEAASIIKCYKELTGTINRDRASVLCSHSAIGAWVLIKNLYH